jgi:SPP1 family predicted phage head-tail adaptor
MRAGRLRCLLALQTRVGSSNSYNETEFSWSTFDSVWAAIEPLSGQEQIIAAQNRSTVSHKITFRWITGVVPTMRGVYDGRTFLFGAVMNRDEKNREITIMATEVADG